MKKVVWKVTFREETFLSHSIHTVLILESSDAWQGGFWARFYQCIGQITTKKQE